jgi:hypothetical protein
MFCASCFACAQTGDEKYCPLDAGQTWNYSFFSKKENLQKDDIQAYVDKSRMYHGILCRVYQSPSKSTTFYISIDKSGVYVRGATVKLPIVGFINVDIVFRPAGQVMKFPVKEGDTWHYQGIAAATTMAFINVETKISGDFTVMGLEEVDVNGKTMTAYHLTGIASRAWSVEKPIKGDCWMAENIGLVKGETVNSRIEMKAFNNNPGSILAGNK